MVCSTRAQWKRLDPKNRKYVSKKDLKDYFQDNKWELFEILKYRLKHGLVKMFFEAITEKTFEQTML